MREPRILGMLLGDSQRDPVFRVLFWGIVTTFAIMVMSAWLQVISRYFLNFPLGWTEELARVMMFWFAYLSVGALVRRRRLMMVDAFVLLLPSRLRLVMSGVNYIIGAAAMIWLAILSIDLVELAAGQTSTALRIPYGLIYVSLPIGLAGAVLYMLAVGIADLGRALKPTGDDTGASRQADI